MGRWGLQIEGEEDVVDGEFGVFDCAAGCLGGAVGGGCCRGCGVDLVAVSGWLC